MRQARKKNNQVAIIRNKGQFFTGLFNSACHEKDIFFLS